MKQSKRDMICGVVLLVWGIGGCVYSFSIPTPAFTNIYASTGVYVLACMLVTIALSIALIVQSLKQRDERVGSPLFTRMVWFILTITACYIASMPLVGYFISTLLYVFIMSTAYDIKQDPHLFKSEKKKHVFSNLALAFMTTIFTQQVFTRLLGVILPSISH